MSNKLSEELSYMRHKIKDWKEQEKDVKNLTESVPINKEDIELIESVVQALVDKILDGVDL